MEEHFKYYSIIYTLLAVVIYGVVQTVRAELHKRQSEGVEEDIQLPVRKVTVAGDGIVTCPVCGGNSTMKTLEKFTLHRCPWCGVKLEVTQ